VPDHDITTARYGNSALHLDPVRRHVLRVTLSGMARSARTRVIIGIVSAAAIVCALPGAASASPGQVDPTFGRAGSGFVVDANHLSDILDKVLRQADGKIIVISSSVGADETNASITVRRYLTSGLLDPSFHQTSIASDFLAAEFGSAALQPDGKIIIVGGHHSTSGFFVVRLRTDGTLDPTFTTAHPTMTFAAGTVTQALAVALGPGGTVVVAGRADEKVGIARFTSTGALDPSFSGDGRTALDFGTHSVANDLAVLPDGRVIIAGGETSAPGDRVVVARINTNGTVDATFGSSGRVDPTKTPIETATSVLLQGTQPVVAGIAGDSTSALTRYNANGTIDPSFGSAGTTRTEHARTSRIQALVADASGRLVGVGRIALSPTDSSTSYTAVFRFSHDGAPDTTFGCAGSTLTEVLGIGDGTNLDESVATSAAADGDNIVVGGFGASLDPFAGGLVNNFLGRFRGAGPHTSGYGVLRGDGGTSAFGGAPACGSAASVALKAPAVGVAYDPVAPGNWTVASDGGVFTFGAARFFGSTGAIHLNQPIVGMAATPDGKGYWLVARDGGIFAFGSARFFGSTGAIHLNQPIVGMAAARDGKGYWLVARDGGVFAFGSAKFAGSTGMLRLNKPIVGVAADPDGTGYWLVGSDGGIFAFSAKFSGSTGAITLNQPIVGIAADPDGTGYWMAARDGGVFAFAAQFNGSTAATPFPVGSVRSTIGVAATP
jgi:uncharacterized delta-60 repeat protein